MANLTQAQIQALIAAGETVTITSRSGVTYTYTAGSTVPSDAILGTYRSVPTIPATVGGTTTLNLSSGSIFNIAMGAGNTTVALSNVPEAEFVAVSVKQDSVGSRLVTWPSTVKWAAGTAPTLSTGASKTDNFLFRSDGTNLWEIARSLDVA